MTSELPQWWESEKENIGRVKIHMEQKVDSVLSSRF
jgi:hypothetical protein